jgi:acyl carrier protein
LAIEEAFKVEIPDSAFGDKPGDMTIQKLADLVAGKMKKERR